MSSDNCITRAVAKAVWGYVGVCNGADCIPNSVEQYYLWIEKILPRNIISEIHKVVHQERFIIDEDVIYH
jgi:hypothetical protein